MPDVDVHKLKSVDDLRPVIELYHHTVRAGLYKEALNLCRDRLTNQLYFQLGAYQVFAELLRALFPDGEDKPPWLESKHDQSWVLNGLGISCAKLGWPRQAADLLERTTRIDGAEGNKRNLAVGLSNLGEQQVSLGELAAAERNFRRSIELSKAAYKKWESTGDRALGRSLALQARFEEADDELKQALENDEEHENSQGLGLTWAYRTQRLLLAPLSKQNCKRPAFLNSSVTEL